MLVTRGYGPGASIALIVLRGYTPGAVALDPTQPYWAVDYWADGYWADNYWFGLSGTPAAPIIPIGTIVFNMLSRDSDITAAMRDTAISGASRDISIDGKTGGTKIT